GPGVGGPNSRPALAVGRPPRGGRVDAAIADGPGRISEAPPQGARSAATAQAPAARPARLRIVRGGAPVPQLREGASGRRAGGERAARLRTGIPDGDRACPINLCLSLL